MLCDCLHYDCVQDTVKKRECGHYLCDPCTRGSCLVCRRNNEVMAKVPNDYQVYIASGKDVECIHGESYDRNLPPTVTRIRIRMSRYPNRLWIGHCPKCGRIFEYHGD